MVTVSLAKFAAFALLGAAFGAIAGLWDLASAALSETVTILLASGFLLGALVPRAAPVWALAIAAGVLGSHLVVPVPLGVAPDAVLPAGLIAAGVALVPALAGAMAGAVAVRAAARLGRL